MAPWGNDGNLDLYHRLELINIIKSQVGLIIFAIMATQGPNVRDRLYLRLYLALNPPGKA